MKRTVIYSVLACAAIAVAYLPPKTRTFEFGPRFYTTERQLVRRLGALARREANALILLEQRDRAIAGLQTLGPHWYFSDADLPVRLDSATRSQLRDPDSLPTLADTPRIAVAVVADTIVRFRSVIRIPPRIGPRIYHLPPAATDGQTCLTVAAAGPDAIQEFQEAEDDQLLFPPWNRSRLLGLCEYYHRFGQPSETVEAWLLAGALKSDGALRTRCAREDLEACEFLALPSRYETADGRIDFAIWNRGPLGSLPSFDFTDEAFLEATIDSLGVDPFQRFWRDQRPVEHAFEATFGLPLVHWVQAWYERNARAGGSPTGPRPGTKTLLLTAATIAGALVWAIVARSGVLTRARRK